MLRFFLKRKVGFVKKWLINAMEFANSNAYCECVCIISCFFERLYRGSKRNSNVLFAALPLLD